jgi:hypothetical protein
MKNIFNKDDARKNDLYIKDWKIENFSYEDQKNYYLNYLSFEFII